MHVLFITGIMIGLFFKFSISLLLSCIFMVVLYYFYKQFSQGIRVFFSTLLESTNHYFKSVSETELNYFINIRSNFKNYTTKTIEFLNSLLLNRFVFFVYYYRGHFRLLALNDSLFIHYFDMLLIKNE